MISKTLQLATALVLSVAAFTTAHAHIGYGGRDFGIFADGLDKTLNISQTVGGNFGWADGTDTDFGDSHRVRPFRFTLEDPMLITITIQGGGGLLPGFSIYSGLGHSASADHEGAQVSIDYLDFIGGGKEGAFRALTNWRIGNDLGTSFADLTTFVFEGYAVDGTPANFGPVPGVVGDGVADGLVSATFALLPGDYSLFVGGADYSGTTTTNFPITVGVSNVAPVPEPATGVALIGGLATLCGLRRRRA